MAIDYNLCKTTLKLKFANYVIGRITEGILFCETKDLKIKANNTGFDKKNLRLFMIFPNTVDKELNKQKYLRFDCEISSWKKVTEERNSRETLEATEERKVTEIKLLNTVDENTNMQTKLDYQ